MAVLNIHHRQVSGAGLLIDSLSGKEDRLWPRDSWPEMRLDRPLEEGAAGGHGPIRYTVERYVPGRCIRFRLTGPRGVDGFHEYSTGDGDSLCHVLAMRVRGPARITWPLIYRWLHDALIEDSLDRAEKELTGTVRAPYRWNPYVRFLRAVFSRRAPL
jgi:hypothetical protein